MEPQHRRSECWKSEVWLTHSACVRVLTSLPNNLLLPITSVNRCRAWALLEKGSLFSCFGMVFHNAYTNWMSQRSISRNTPINLLDMRSPRLRRFLASLLRRHSPTRSLRVDLEPIPRTLTSERRPVSAAYCPSFTCQGSHKRGGGSSVLQTTPRT